MVKHLILKIYIIEEEINMKKHFWKGLFVACSLLLATPLTACSTFFGGSEYLIDDVTAVTNDNGDTVVTITFSDNTVPNVVFTIPKGQEGNGIKDIKSEYDENGQRIKITISFTDPSVEDYIFYIPVIKGEQGNGISEVKVDTLENGDQVLTFSYSDGRNDTVITIPRGQAGNGIESINIEQDEQGNLIATITFTDLDMPPVSFTIPKGNPGNGITMIETSETDNKYILTIYYDNGLTDTIEFDKPTTNEWYYGNNDPSDNIGRIGDFYLNTYTGDVFIKVADGSASGHWKFYLRLGNNPGQGGDKEQYIVAFDYNGGNPINPDEPRSIKVDEGKCIDLPLAQKDGFEFIGWYTDLVIDANTAHFTDATPVTQDWTLYAHYEAL